MEVYSIDIVLSILTESGYEKIFLAKVYIFF